MNHRRRFAIACLTLALALPAIAQQTLADLPDAYYGDYQGTLTVNGQPTPLVAQVVCFGREGYWCNLLPKFDERVAPLAVWRGGKVVDGAVVFGDNGRIAEGVFTGKLNNGTFELRRVLRVSPTMGLPAPEGATVLLGGGDLSAWRLNPNNNAAVINLAQLLKGSERVGYLRATITSPRAQAARCEVGSDDGIKVWLNGAVVFAKNAPRPCTPFEDKFDVQLKEGANELLLKVTQGGGDWAACARLVGPDGRALEGVTYAPATRLAADATLADYQGDNPGAILTWEATGPYFEEGQTGAALFDVPLGPEVPGATVEWKVVNDRPRRFGGWELKPDGSMVVVPGTGSFTSQPVFRNFKAHVEFRSPYMPDARGQGRGNSGVYFQGRYEVQVLDSYGLEGEPNECGGIYKYGKPLAHMCAPPMVWQTYDVEFTAARYDEAAGKVVAPRITVRHNGVLIHDNYELEHNERGGPGYVGSGPILLQDHGNPVEYRNIWVLPVD